MANEKISQMPAISSFATGDLLPIVDISEISTSDQNKSVTFGELFRNVLGGTASAPSIAFTGDQNTGLYSPGADQVAISTNGTGRIYIDSDGRLLAGTSSDLAIAGRGSLQVANNGPNQLYAARFSADGNSSVLNFVKSRGTSIGSHGALLSGDVAGGISFTGSNGSSYGELGAIRCSAESAPGVSTFPGALLFLTSTGSVPGERLRITSDGKVGIGTSSPGATLHVSGAASGTNLLVGFSTTALAVGNYEATGEVRLSAIDTSGTNAKFLTFYTNPSGTSNGTERARIDSSGRLLVGTSSASTTLGALTAKFQIAGTSVFDTGISTALFENSNNPAQLQLAKSRNATIGGQTVVQANDTLGRILFGGSDGTAYQTSAWIQAEVDGTPGANDMPGRLVFSTTADGASSPTERLRIGANGSFRIGQTTTDTPGLSNTTVGIGMEPANGAIFLSRGDGSSLFVNRNSDGASTGFYRSGTLVGTISVTTTATAYNTSSDYRLKENIVPLTGAADRVNQLQVHRFNFIADASKTVDGFLAHEAQAVVPECVTGTKDEVDDDGNPVYQGIDQSKLVPLLTAALQEALAEIESLKARVTALEP